jgi:large subunit ribosomal protein L15
MAEELNLHSLKPAQPRKDRKRVGRGMGSGKGRYSGRGIKGQKSRSGSHYMPAGFEGGQMPIDMRLPKLRGNTSADAMPIGPFRTSTQPVNLRDLEARFEAGAEVTPDTLVTARLIKNTKIDIKILGSGELTKKLSVSAHGFSKTAKEKIEAAGGTVSWLRGEPVEKKPKRSKAKAPVRATRSRRSRRRRRGSGRREATDGADEAPQSNAELARQRLACPGAPAARSLHGLSCSPSTGSARGCPHRASTRPRSRATSTAAAARSSAS